MRVGLVSIPADTGTSEQPADTGTNEQQRHVADLAHALARDGHDVRIYLPGDGDFSIENGITVERADTVDAQEFGRWLHERWRAGRKGWRPDVVHTHFWLGGLAALPAAADRGIPVVHTYHSLGSMRRRWYGRAEPGSRERVRAERMLGGRVDRVVALSHAEVEELTQLGLPRTEIAVVPSGVDIEMFSPRGETAPADPDRRRVLAVGQPSPDSGYDEMVEALRWVPDAELVIAGGPEPDRLDVDPAVERLRRLADERGLTGRVRFLGAVPIDHLPRWYRSADVFASTSADETFGLPAVEAMACGAPVVAYGIGGVVESVVHRVTGVLVQPHDIRGFALALRRLLRNDLDRLAYADAGVDRAQSRYDWRRVVADVTRVYDEVLRHPREHAPAVI